MLNFNADKYGRTTYNNNRGPRLSPQNVAIGIAISLLLHSLLAIWAWNMKLPAATQAERFLDRVLQVRLLPPPPAPADVQRQEPAELTNVRQPMIRVPRSAPRSAPIIAAQPQAASGNAAPKIQAPEQHLDLSAVHANLGAIVAEVDREKRDTPVGQLQEKPLSPADDENKIGKAIRNTTRSDCRDHIANTGLLAPLFLLAMAADKKDSGCKW